MSKVPNWFERQFNFTLSIDQYPTVCIRLRGTPPRLEEVIRGAPRQILTRKLDGKWSPQEHAGHLLDLEPLWMARVEDFLTDREILTAADLSNRTTTEADHNAKDVRGVLAEFRAARLRLFDRIQGLPLDSLGRERLHPRLKRPMRLIDHLVFIAEHDDHHLAKVWELVADH